MCERQTNSSAYTYKIFTLEISSAYTYKVVLQKKVARTNIKFLIQKKAARTHIKFLLQKIVGRTHIKFLLQKIVGRTHIKFVLQKKVVLQNYMYQLLNLYMYCVPSYPKILTLRIPEPCTCTQRNYRYMYKLYSDKFVPGQTKNIRNATTAPDQQCSTTSSTVRYGAKYLYRSPLSFR